MSLFFWSRLRKAALFTAACCMVIASTGCTPDTRRTQLQSQLDNLTGECNRARQAVTDQQSMLVSLNQRLTQERSQLQEYNAGVQGYMMQHKMAVAALVAGVAGTVPWINDNGTYSEDAKEIGAAITAIAVIWALSNMDEVSEVLSTLNQADAHVRSLEAEIGQTSSASDQQGAGLQQAQERLAALSRQSSAVQQNLANL